MLELQVRLRWLRDPETLLPRMVAFWQDIALLPILTADERSLAESRSQQARDNAAKIESWRKHLKDFSDSLDLPSGEDVIPKQGDDWWGWIVNQFHLRRVPVNEQLELVNLRQRLAMVRHDLGVEIWPETKLWNRLLSDLRIQFGDEVDQMLPERFNEIQEEIQALRDSASQWLEQL
jgi:hypothetical protein